jgi:hypothetical protein
MTGVFIGKGDRDKIILRDDTENEVRELQVKKPGTDNPHWKLETVKEGLSPTGFRGNMALPTSSFWTSSFRNCRTINSIATLGI